MTCNILGRLANATSDGFIRNMAVYGGGRALVKSIRFFNKASSTTYYIQIHDQAASPSDMTNCKYIMTATAASNGGEEFPNGLLLANGIRVIVSSSASAATVATADDVMMVVQFEIVDYL